jgi:hypothetical protein
MPRGTAFFHTTGEKSGLAFRARDAQLLQALIELSAADSQERSTLGSPSDHTASRGGMTAPQPPALSQAKG